MRHHCRIVFVALTVLAAGTLFGCAGPQPKSVPTAAPDTGGPGIVHLDSAAIDMITDSGGFPAKRYLVDKATEHATAQCMHAAGVSWSGFAGEPPAASDEDWILDPQARRKHGYGIAEPAAGEKGDISNGAEGTDDPRMMPALVGSPPKRATLTIPGMAQYSYPDSGCLAEARAAVAGDTAAWARLAYLPSELNLRLSPTPATDPRYITAQHKWKQCMADHGHPYSTPADIRAHLTQEVSAHPQRRAALRAEEITLAVQDAQCDHEAHLSLTELALRRAATQNIEPAQCKEISDLTTVLDTAASRAREILK